MIHHIIVSRVDGYAYTQAVKSIPPAVFDPLSIFAGQPAFAATYNDGQTWLEHPYQLAQDPRILYHMGGDFYCVQLSEADVAALPYKTPMPA